MLTILDIHCRPSRNLRSSRNMASPAVQSPLTAFSYIALITFFVCLVFCFTPVKAPVPPWKRKDPWFYFRLNVATAPPLGVAFLLATTSISFENEVKTGFLGFGDVQPWAIVVLIISLSYISISLELSGLFGHVAYRVAALGGKSGRKLFLYLYICTALIAAIFSNDVVVLVLTPIVLYFTRILDVDALPFLISTFQVSNIASQALVTGNPTNILVAQAKGLNFLTYSAWMMLPAIVSTVVSFALLMGLFWKRIPVEVPDILGSLANNEAYKIHDQIDCWTGLAAIVGALLTLLVVSFFKHVSVALLTAPWAGALLLKDIIRDLLSRKRAEVRDTDRPADAEATSDIALDFDEIGNAASKLPDAMKVPELNEPVAGTNGDVTDDSGAEEASIFSKEPPAALRRLKRSFPRTFVSLSRVPWTVAPFCLSLFILVEALNTSGWTSRFAWCLAFLCPNKTAALFSIGFLSALASNLLNNLPMTIFFVRCIESPFFVQFAAPTAAAGIKDGAYWGLVAGSNMGGNLTPIGALAGLIWLTVLGRFRFEVTWPTFIRYGVAATPFVVAVARAVLAAELAIIEK